MNIHPSGKALGATIEGIVTRALADAAYRKRVLADLESALAEAGVEPTPPILDELRARFPPG